MILIISIFELIISTVIITTLYYISRQTNYFGTIMSVAVVYATLIIFSIAFVSLFLRDSSKFPLIKEALIFILFALSPYIAMGFLSLDFFIIIGLIFKIKLLYSFKFTISYVMLSLVIIAFTLGYGFINSRNTKIFSYQLDISRNKPKHQTLKIAVMSDLHISAYIDKHRSERLVKLVNQQHPDLILLVGDIFDRANPYQLKISGHAEYLRNLRATLGVYAVLGNHEYYGDNKHTVEYIKNLRIHLLEDEYVLINENFYLVGRQDYKAKLAHKIREDLPKLLAPLNRSYPIIMMDHQPHNLQEVSANNIDIAVFGHTHNGQYFPGNLFVKLFYKLTYGYLKKGNSNIFVSSGFGTWGPQIRIGTHSEIIILKVTI